jgi:hypothetical protein
MTRPSPEELLGETARLAYHLHWPLETILDLEHADRRRFLAEAEGLAASVPVYVDEEASQVPEYQFEFEE